MYSKAGRATSEMFTILQHSENFFEPKIKSRTPSNPQKLDKLSDLVAKNIGQKRLASKINSLLEVQGNSPMGKLDAVKASPAKNSKNAKFFEPFSKNISRDEREKTLSPKRVKSNAAYYNPKFECVDKRMLNVVDYSRSSSKRLFDGLVASSEGRDSLSNSMIEGPAIPEKPSAKLKGAIPLGLQAGRPDILEEIIKRKINKTDALTGSELPAILSSIPHLPNIKFAKGQPRKGITIETAAANCPIYYPNHEVVKRSLGRVGAQLSKIIGRKDNTKIPIYTNESTYDYEEYVTKNKSHIFPRVRCPTFDKMAPRDRSSVHSIQGYATPELSRSPKNDSMLSSSKVKLHRSRSEVSSVQGGFQARF